MSENEFKPTKFVMLTLEEFIRLVICVFFDTLEFALPILLGPLVGDILDIVGFWTSILLFGWIGCLSILELIPMADYFPIFVFTWGIWYYRKKRKEQAEQERLKKSWV